jgi:RNA polymerase sigma-70 factor, ECF subfamily
MATQQRDAEEIPMINTAPPKPVPNHSEAELVQALLTDDALAWREFNERYSRLMYRCISRVISRFGGVTSQDDVREVYSTLCLQLLAKDKHKLRSFDPERGTKLGTWLGMLATHAAYDLLRSKRRMPHVEALDASSPVKLNRPAPDEVCDARQRARLVCELLQEFSEKDRQFFQLYFGEGLDPEQVAEQMQISVKTVYSKKHKIRSRLETLLSQRCLAA